MPRPAYLIKESVVESHLVAECAKLRVLCPKNKGVRGWPDRTAYWFDGVTDLIETKRPKGGTFEPLQLRTHAKLRQRGHEVFVLTTKAEVDAYIELRRAHGKVIGERIDGP